MKPFFVYMLKCSDGSYYTGHTDNIESRLSAHHQGKGSSYTSTRLPVELVYVETCGTRYEALANERMIKGWTRQKKEALIKEDWKEIQRLTNYNVDSPNSKNEFIMPVPILRTLRTNGGEIAAFLREIVAHSKT